MKKKFMVISLIVFLALSSVLGLAACDKDEGVAQIPVYQGMSISNGQSAVAKTISTSIVLAQVIEPDNHGNYNGDHHSWHKGDYSGKDQDINQEIPFPDNENDENIEEETKSSLEVIDAGQEIYYATANEDIFINIHISNPDNYEIIKR